MGLPCCGVLGSSGYLMAAEAPPPTRCRFKTTWDMSREAVFKCFTCICFYSRSDNGIREDVSPYCTHFVWRTLWLLLPFTPGSGCKGDPSPKAASHLFLLLLGSPITRNPNVGAKLSRSVQAMSHVYGFRSCRRAAVADIVREKRSGSTRVPSVFPNGFVQPIASHSPICKDLP